MSKLKWLFVFITLSIVTILLLPANQPKDNTIFSRDPFSQSVRIGDIAQPSYKIRFPADHLEHTNFDIEWWYLTANLTSEDGGIFGLQWTLFRFRNPDASLNNGWSNDQIYMAHASVHTLDQHFFTEKYARGGVGNAGNFSNPYRLNIDNWQWLNINNTNDLFPALLSFSAMSSSNKEMVSAELSMTQTGPFILHGADGYSIKSANGKHASHYYSAPFIDMKGVLTVKDNQNGDSTEISVSGSAWYDHEWTSQLLNDETAGWDWMSLHLDNGDKLMAFRMRLNQQPDYITGTYIESDGSKSTLLPSDISLTSTRNVEIKGKSVPLSWRVTVEKVGLAINVHSLKDDQWNDATIPYYEGMVSVDGSHTGKGFIELTGYN